MWKHWNGERSNQPHCTETYQAGWLSYKVVCVGERERSLASPRILCLTDTSLINLRSALGLATQPLPDAMPEKGVIARSVESMLPEILASESEPDYKKSAPAELSEVGSLADMDAIIDFHGTTVVARMYAQASPDLQQTIKDFYPGIGAIVTSELGGSEFNKIADRAGFLPNHEPDAVRVDMLIQENARLDEALRLCEEHVERLERENIKLHKKVDSLQKKNIDLRSATEEFGAKRSCKGIK